MGLDAVIFVLMLLGIGALGLLAGGGRNSYDFRRRRWEDRFEHESRRTYPTDATGMLMCRSCGSSAREKAGRCPRCGAIL